MAKDEAYYKRLEQELEQYKSNTKVIPKEEYATIKGNAFLRVCHGFMRYVIGQPIYWVGNGIRNYYEKELEKDRSKKFEFKLFQFIDPYSIKIFVAEIKGDEEVDYMIPLNSANFVQYYEHHKNDKELPGFVNFEMVVRQQVKAGKLIKLEQ